MVNILRQPLFLFVLKILGVYLFWQILYTTYLHSNSSLDLTVVELTIKHSKWILNLLGFRTFTGAVRLIGIDNTSGLWMGDPCNGIILFALFSSFIIAFPGPLKSKIWFIPSGIIIIYLANVLRVVLLAIIQLYVSRSTLEFHHTYTFTYMVYSLIFFMWWIWVNQFSGLIKKGEK
jgi:exosortase family protein XrtF